MAKFGTFSRRLLFTTPMSCEKTCYHFARRLMYFKREEHYCKFHFILHDKTVYTVTMG